MSSFIFKQYVVLVLNMHFFLVPRNHDPYLRMQESSMPGMPQLQGYYNQNRPPEYDDSGFHSQVPGSQLQYPGSQFQPVPQQDNTGAPLSRAEKIQQLRADHQRRHRERQGQYPMEDKEEEYEKQIQEEERRVGHNKKKYPRLPSDSTQQFFQYQLVWTPGHGLEVSGWPRLVVSTPGDPGFKSC